LLILVLGSRVLRALDTSEQRYRLLFADTPQPMAVYDPATGRFVEANAAACRMLGYAAGELVGMPVLDCVLPDDRPDARRLMERSRTSGEGISHIRKIQCRDGRIVQVEMTSSPVLFEGRVLRLVMIQDHTARLQAEGALIRSLDRLARQEADRTQLAHALAHDLREPVRQAASFVQLLERRYRGRLDHEADQYIDFATEGIHRLNRLLADLHTFTEVPSVAIEEVDSGEVLQGVLATLAPQIGPRDGVCIGEMPRLGADPRSLSVVFTALIDNALKFRRPQAPCRVEVSAERLGADWCFTVKDDGIGIEPEYREVVFQLFGRLHTRDRVPGNGTGLALARKLVEAAGGRIWLDEGQGNGAVFRFTLPVRPVRDPARH
ncbi:MAG: ATP-binding protein, partial [Pseudomonadota bacterium]